jgi:hypothetical protein
MTDNKNSYASCSQIAELKLLIGQLSNRIISLETEQFVRPSNADFVQLKEENLYLAEQMDLMQRQSFKVSPYETINSNNSEPKLETDLVEYFISIQNPKVGTSVIKYFASRRNTI